MLQAPSIKNMSLLNDVGFAAHVHFFQYNGHLHPVEIAISDVYSDKSFGVLVDPPQFLSSHRDSDQNNYLSTYVHKIKFPPPKMGSLPLDEAEKFLKTHYLWLDRGRGQRLAVRGLSQKRFFHSLGFRVIDVETDMFQQNGSSLFNYRPDPNLQLQQQLQQQLELQQEENFKENIAFLSDESHRHRVHMCGDDSECAGRLAGELADWIHKMKLNHFQELTNKSFLFNN